MTDVELLKLQVEALEKLVKIKDDTISELQRQALNKPTVQYIYWYYPYTVPNQWINYPYYGQPYYGGAQGGAGGTLQGGTGGGQSGVVTFTGYQSKAAL